MQHTPSIRPVPLIRFVLAASLGAVLPLVDHGVGAAEDASIASGVSVPPSETEAANPPVRVGVDGMFRFDVTTGVDAVDLDTDASSGTRQVLARVRPTITWEPAAGLQLVAQGQWYGSKGAVEGGTGSLYQAFADLDRGTYSVRAGRQEIVVGSGFVLGADSFYDGALYDAVRLTVRPRARVAVDVFGGRFASVNSCGVQGNLFGAAVHGEDAAGRVIEAYAIVDESEPSGTAQRVDTIGLRAVAGLGRFTFELEPIRQSGWGETSGGDRAPISAWGGHAELAYAPELPRYRPLFVLGYARASGDAHPDEGSITAFRHPNHDTPQVGDIGLIGDLSGVAADDAAASGLAATSLTAAAAFGSRTRVSATFHDFRASSVTGATSRAVGRELDLVLELTLSEHVGLAVSFDRFNGGRFFRQAKGASVDVRYGYAALHFGF